MKRASGERRRSIGTGSALESIAFTALSMRTNLNVVFPDGRSNKLDRIRMNSLITEAARALAAGDPRRLRRELPFDR